MTTLKKSSNPLISVTELNDLLSDSSDLVLLDCSFDLKDPSSGEKSFLEAHIPSALYVHLDRDLSGAKTPKAGRHPLQFQSLQFLKPIYKMKYW